MNIYILTSDKNIQIVEGLQYCINKYWKPNPKVILLGYKEPKFELDSNFTFISLGEDRGAGKVGEDIITYFSKVLDEHFIFSVLFLFCAPFVFGSGLLHSGSCFVFVLLLY